MITYPRRAITALVYLFRPYNDIDVYVEDTTCRNMYQVLLERMLDGHATVKRVFQIGGRKEVIEACEVDQGNSGRPRLYIIDGDLDALFGNEPPNLKHLYQLKVYCSENLIITPAALCEVTLECLPDVSRDEIDSSIRFSQFLDDVVEKLVPLLVVYGVAYLLGVKESKTTGFNIMQLTAEQAKTPHLSESKIHQRVAEIRSELDQACSKDEVDSAVELVETILLSLPTDLVKFIPGKTHLLPLVFHCLRSKAKFSGTLEQFRVRLARHCELDIDPGLPVAIRQVSRN